MTTDAQSALRRVIEKYTSNARFCMICNYVNKIMPALQSRCTKFRFAPLKPEQIRGRLKDVIAAEQVDISNSGAEAILELACGDLRRVLNLLQSSSMAYKKVDEEAVYLTAGAALPAVIDDLFNSLMQDSFPVAYKKVQEATKLNGYALVDIVTKMSILLAETDLPDKAVSLLMDRLSTIEHRLAHGVSEKIQVGALVGVFTLAREMLGRSAA